MGFAFNYDKRWVSHVLVSSSIDNKVNHMLQAKVPFSLLPEFFKHVIDNFRSAAA